MVKIEVELEGTPTTITWTEPIAKKKMAEFIFSDYLNPNKYTRKEQELTSKFNRIYNPKKVAKSSKGIEGFTKTEYKNIFKSSLSYIQNNKLQKIIEEFNLELDEKTTSFIEGDKGKEVIDEKLSDLNNNSLSRIYEQEEVSKKAERGLELGLTENEAKAYFLDKMQVQVGGEEYEVETAGKKEKKMSKKPINTKEYIIDGRKLFSDDDNVKLKKLKELGFKQIGFAKKEQKAGKSLLAGNEGRINLGESQDLYSSLIERDEDGKPIIQSGKYKMEEDRSYKFQKVPFGNTNTGEELQTVSDALMIKFGAEWEKKNKDGLVKEYEKLTKPIKKLKPIIDKYRTFLMREIQEKYQGEDLEMGELKEEYEKYSKTKKGSLGLTLGEDYTINIDGKTKSITEAIVDSMMLIDNKALRRDALMRQYKDHEDVLKLVEMIGNKKPYSFISSLIKPTDYRVDVKQGDTSFVIDEMKDIQKAKTEYAKNELKNFEEKSSISTKIGVERTRLADKKIENHARDMFEDESKVIDYFINQLTDLKHIYFIKVTIEKIPSKKEEGSPTYAIRSNKKQGKSEMLKQRILINRKYSSATTTVVDKTKTNYKLIATASNIINELKRNITLLKNIGSA